MGKLDKTFWITLVVMLGLMLTGLFLNLAHDAELFVQTCEKDSILVVSTSKIDPEEGLTALDIVDNCVLYYEDAPKVCHLKPGLYIISCWDSIDHYLIYSENLLIDDKDGKYFSTLNCGDDL